MDKYTQMTEISLEHKKTLLKLEAYKEKVAELEDKHADLRVEITVLSQHVQQLSEENYQLQQSQPDSGETVVQEETEAAEEG